VALRQHKLPVRSCAQRRYKSRRIILNETSFTISFCFNIDVTSTLGSSYGVHSGSISDVSELHAASILMVESRRMSNVYFGPRIHGRGRRLIQFRR
jgi:hypothetical protein